MMSLEDKVDVVESLADLGIAKSAIEFTRRGRYAPSIISVEIELVKCRRRGNRSWRPWPT